MTDWEIVDHKPWKVQLCQYDPKKRERKVGPLKIWPGDPERRRPLCINIHWLYLNIETNHPASLFIYHQGKMSIPKQEYTSLKVEGPLYVIQVTPAEVKRKHSVVYILMGPTGSGKSAFIETLAPGRNLCISKGSLESVTQSVSYYEVANLKNTGGYPKARWVLIKQAPVLQRILI
ncbi:hypothetical protein BJ165DRAFT_1599033 [Panaeolus papilionaceus]|nr:hypothetical protein BJ165DRAFT_1599033 [Panaeolus papilionaceus]